VQPPRQHCQQDDFVAVVGPAAAAVRPVLAPPYECQQDQHLQRSSCWDLPHQACQDRYQDRYQDLCQLEDQLCCAYQAAAAAAAVLTCAHGCQVQLAAAPAAQQLHTC
jgi:hypothetical protein